MPYKRVSPPVSPDHPDLVDALSKELEAARASGPEDAPYIIEEVLPRSDFYNVRVIWDRWSQLTPRERMGVILESYRRVRGDEGMRKVSSALGVTRQEAQKLSIQF